MDVGPGSVALLEPVLGVLPTPKLLVEPGTARVLYANPAARRLAGGALPVAVAERIARGERLHGVAVDSEARSLLVSADTVALPGAGEIAVVSLEDVTELQAARRHAALLAEAGPRLASSLDPAEVAATVAQLAVPAWADWCFVELLRPDGSIVREAIAHADPGKQALTEEYDRRYPLDPQAPFGSPQVIRSGEPELVPEITEELLTAVAVDERQLELLREVGLRSSLVVPLRAHGRVIGDLALASAESGRRYAHEDLEPAQELADRCALALENARLYTELSDAEAAARRAGEEVDTILGGVPDAVTAQAPDGRLVYANDAAVRMIGYASVEELLAAPIDEVAGRFEMRDEDGRPVDVERLPGRRALRGERTDPLILRSRGAGQREYRWTRVQSTPVFDAGGGVRLAINVIEDITDIKRAEQRQRFLAEAGRVLAGSLDYEETLATVASLAVPDISDWCAVDVRVDGRLRRVAVTHADPRKVADAQEIARRYPPDPGAPVGVYAVLRSGRSEVYAEITDEVLAGAAQDGEHLELLRSIGMSSAMLVPMTLRGQAVGVITFVNAEAGRSYSAADLELAESLASRAAAAVENSRLYATRSAIARTLQASLLPPELPELPGLELAAAYRAAGEGIEVGGDFYDVFSIEENLWYLVIGDVCGKGAEAAAVTAMARYTIRATAVRRRSLAAILRLLSEAMVRQESPETAGRFCTIACLELDLSQTPVRATVACGGHPRPILLRADGRVEELGEHGTLLGLVEHPELADRSGELLPGDALLLYTDGLTEAGAPEHVWAPEDLAAVLQRAAGGSAQQIVDEVVGAALGVQPAPRDHKPVLAQPARCASAG
jgi:PAS domain S-box-containing protein